MTIDVIKHYLQFVTKSVDEFTGAITFTSLDGNFQIFAHKCEHDLRYKHDLMNLWKKHGFISETLPTHICIDTYYTDCNNNCYGWYNITHKRSEDGKRTVVNFAYLREWNDDNIAELVAECLRMREMDIRTH